jgi:hypothetical protein
MGLTALENRYLDSMAELQFPTMPPEASAEGMSQPQESVQVAAGPSEVMRDAGPYADRGYGEFKEIQRNPVVGSIADFVRNVRSLADQYEIKDWVPLLGGMGVGELLIGKAPEEIEEWAYGNAPMRVPEMSNIPVMKTGRGEQLADTAFVGLDAAGITKGLGVIGKGAARQLGPKAAEMTERYMQRTGMMPGVVEDLPRLVQERVPGVQPGEELIVQHNLTASNLMKADKLGGLPVPSLAISRAANPMDNFGEITLIAPKEFANPSAKNPVFRADAYTARFPNIDFQFDPKSAKGLQAFMGDVLEAVPDGQRKLGSLMDDWKNRQYSDLLRAKFLQERGELPDPKQFENPYLFQGAVNKRIDSLGPEYADWTAGLDDRLKDAGVNIKERIFKGFTYSGDRRYAAATLDNIVKEMKGGAGSEGFNYGVGNLRAVATPRFRTLAQVKAARGKLVDGKKMDEIKQQAQDAYVDILERMRGVNERYSAEDALLEFAESKRISTLDRIYDGKMPDDLKADIGIFLQKIQELPTEYFELKPQRAVTLDEFRGAIIPKDTPQSARDVLNKAGITEVYEYSTPEERKALFQKYGKEMFTAAPAGTGIGAATMQDKENE